MVGVGLLTYIVVFNINHIVMIGKKRYKYAKMTAVERMRKGENSSWKETGELFHRYEPERSSETAKPSEWWILVHQIRRLVELVRSEERR